jgi:hypothetical protein
VVCREVDAPATRNNKKAARRPEMFRNKNNFFDISWLVEK